jgi:hypothetical protein
MNNYIYQKPEGATYNLRRILGEGKYPNVLCQRRGDLTYATPGILVTEGDVHKNQVRTPVPRS